MTAPATLYHPISDATLIAADNLKTRAEEYLAQPNSELRFELCAAMALINTAISNSLVAKPSLRVVDQRHALSTKFDTFVANPTARTLSSFISTANNITQHIHNAFAKEIA